jgi:hypothetical protein
MIVQCCATFDCTSSLKSKKFICYDVVEISSVCGLKISKDIKDVLDIGSAHQVVVVLISTYIKDALDIGSTYYI